MITHPRTNPPTLVGTRLTLRPTEAEDAATFSQIAPIETFRYYVAFAPQEQSKDGFVPYVQFVLDTPTTQGFTIILNETQDVIGSTCYLDIRPEDDHVEIGMTWYAPEYRGTFVNPEAKLLMLQYAFDTLGCEKVTLKSDARNAHSRAAMEKLGAQFEGILRRHRFTCFGEFRDTSYYGILKEEWSTVKQNLLARLSLP